MEKWSSRGRLLEHLESSGSKIMNCMPVMRGKKQRKQTLDDIHIIYLISTVVFALPVTTLAKDVRQAQNIYIYIYYILRNYLDS